MIIAINKMDEYGNIIITSDWVFSCAMVGEIEEKFKVLYKEYIGRDLKYIDMHGKDYETYMILNKSVYNLNVYSDNLKEDLKEIRKHEMDKRIMEANVRSFIDYYLSTNLVSVSINIIKD